MKTRIMLSLVLALSLGLAGCDFGEVDQGRTVGFDEAARKVKVALDDHNPADPSYDLNKEAFEFVLPDDPKEVGPLPKAGSLLKVDPEKGIVLVYDKNTNKPVSLTVKVVDKVMATTNDPKVKGKTFPQVADGKVTVYIKRIKTLCTFEIPDNAPSDPDIWKLGDEVRLYYKPNAKHQALRFMNIDQTNIYKR